MNSELESEELSISVVMPAKNEGGIIGSVVREIFSVLSKVEVLVVDDGSTDNTLSEAEKNGARVVSHPYSKGNGAAIKTGAREAKGDVIVFMDSDGQHRPEDILTLLEKYKEGFDMVVGARSRKSQASIERAVGNKIYNTLASWVTGQSILDLTSGFRVVSASKFREFLHLLPNGFSYPTTSTMAFFKAGYSVGYVPIVAEKRVGASHINIASDGVRFLLIIFKVGTLYSPLRIFVPIAVLFFLVGLSYYGYTYFSYGRFTNMSALLFTTGVIIFLIGLVSEQITSLLYSKNG